MAGAEPGWGHGGFEDIEQRHLINMEIILDHIPANFLCRASPADFKFQNIISTDANHYSFTHSIQQTQFVKRREEAFACTPHTV